MSNNPVDNLADDVAAAFSRQVIRKMPPRYERVIDSLLQYIHVSKSMGEEGEALFFRALVENLVAETCGFIPSEKSNLWSKLGDIDSISNKSLLEGAKMVSLVYHALNGRDLFNDLKPIMPMPLIGFPESSPREGRIF